MSDIQAIREEYERLAHAMQAAVAFKMHHDPSETTPKHLRVGVNAAMSDQGGLAKLLIDKGIITELEYVTAMRDAMRRELDMYHAWAASHGYGAVKFV